MPSKYKVFKDLHYANELLILPNAWDVKSAMVCQQQNFPAVATSSAAVAEALGYQDGEELPFDHYLFVMQRILAKVEIPLTVDLEMGYGKTNDAIARNIEQVASMGVAGINLEDSEITGAGRSQKDANQFASLLEQIKKHLKSKNLELFINVRCDTYILNVEGKQDETARRLKIYEAAGADGIFLPCIADEKDIAAAVSQTRLPINVMCIPGLPGFERLQQLGVKRVSMGPFLFEKTYQRTAELLQRMMAEKNVTPIL